MMLVAIVLAILAPSFARLLQLSISRQREFLADATAVRLTRNPKGLADALQKISGDREVLEVANRPPLHSQPHKEVREAFQGSLLYSSADRGEDHDPTRHGVGRSRRDQRTNLDGDPIKRYNIRRCIAGWCNGSTSDSESLSPGSNPGPAASKFPAKEQLHGEARHKHRIS